MAGEDVEETEKGHERHNYQISDGMLEALTSLFSSTAQGCTLCCTVGSASNFHELDVEAAVMCFNFMMCRGSLQAVECR